MRKVLASLALAALAAALMVTTVVAAVPKSPTWACTVTSTSGAGVVAECRPINDSGTVIGARRTGIRFSYEATGSIYTAQKNACVDSALPTGTSFYLNQTLVGDAPFYDAPNGTLDSGNPLTKAPRDAIGNRIDLSC